MSEVQVPKTGTGHGIGIGSHIACKVHYQFYIKQSRCLHLVYILTIVGIPAHIQPVSSEDESPFLRPDGTLFGQVLPMMSGNAI